MKRAMTIVLGCGLALALLTPALKSASADEDKPTALKLIQHEAIDGDANAQLLYGLAYLEGRDGLVPDVKKAIHWLRRSARDGNTYAMLTLGEINADGQGVTQDSTKATRWWLMAARGGNSRAQYLLGKSLLEGEGVKQNPAQAISWLEKSASQGDKDAQFLLGKTFHEGKVVAPDHAAARNWLQRAAEQAHTEAINLLAVLNNIVNATTPVYQQSADLLIKKARQGDPQAEFELGLRYESGAWDVHQDNQKALSWITRSANSGNKTAMKTLADIYRNGDLGLAADPAKATMWEKKAALAKLEKAYR